MDEMFLIFLTKRIKRKKKKKRKKDEFDPMFFQGLLPNSIVFVYILK